MVFEENQLTTSPKTHHQRMIPDIPSVFVNGAT
jgi:hypothetical protein